MNDIDGYEVLNISSEEITEEQYKEIMRKGFIHAINSLMDMSKGKSFKEMSDIWEVITSRGKDKLIYGPMPDVFK